MYILYLRLYSVLQILHAKKKGEPGGLCTQRRGPKSSSGLHSKPHRNSGSNSVWWRSIEPVRRRAGQLHSGAQRNTPSGLCANPYKNACDLSSTDYRFILSDDPGAFACYPGYSLQSSGGTERYSAGSAGLRVHGKRVFIDRSPHLARHAPLPHAFRIAVQGRDR